MDDFSHLDGLAQAALVASKQVKPAELLESAIARAEAVNPQLNFMAQKLYDRARNAPAGTGPFASSGPQPSALVPVPAVVVDEGIDEAWAHRYGAVHGENAVWRARTEAYGRMLGGLGPSILGGAVLVGDLVAGVGFVVLERGWAGIYGMGTAPAWRRTGVAGALLGALAREARRRHGTHAYLQVELDNVGAQSLYRGMGFGESHAYHYRVSASV